MRNLSEICDTLLEDITNKQSKAIFYRIKEMIGQVINVKGKDDTRILAECKIIGLYVKCEEKPSEHSKTYYLYYKDHILAKFYVVDKVENNIIGFDISAIMRYNNCFLEEIRYKQRLIEMK